MEAEWLWYHVKFGINTLFVGFDCIIRRDLQRITYVQGKYLHPYTL